MLSVPNHTTFVSLLCGCAIVTVCALHLEVQCLLYDKQLFWEAGADDSCLEFASLLEALAYVSFMPNRTLLDIISASSCWNADSRWTAKRQRHRHVPASLIKTPHIWPETSHFCRLGNVISESSQNCDANQTEMKRTG